ncbi:MAG TPA: tRNA adenosine deaminase-associated protein [Mycobacteriales bacterium]|jgi:putative tRNA adenosine deaminase-associated protein|nr:tRNA adenosine deaminase-associated protein [Mycobacteriales bacterium]
MGGQARDTVAVVVYREDGSWRSDVLPERITDDLDALIRVLRQQPADNGAIALVNVADEFFVALRVSGDEVRMMLSDASAAVAWDLARQVTDRLGIDTPDDEEGEDIWPAGDIGIFADLGLNEMELGVLLDDLDAYADEMLLSVADRLGFADVYDRALELAIS